MSDGLGSAEQTVTEGADADGVDRQVFHTSRVKPTFLFLSGLMFLAAWVSVPVDVSQALWFGGFIVWAFLVLMGAAGVLGRRPRLELTGEGLAYFSLGIVQRAAWREMLPPRRGLSLQGRAMKDTLFLLTVRPASGRSKTIAVPDVFTTPFATIVEAIETRQALLGPSSAPGAAASTTDVVLTRHPVWLTYTLAAVLAAVFVAELAVPVTPGSAFLSPSPATLLAYGASHQFVIVTMGQWWRLASSTFLHGSLVHLGLNLLALVFVGRALERLVGAAWLGAIYAAGGIGASLVSLAFLSPQSLGVGASGAIMALLAALFVASYRLPEPERTKLMSLSARWLVPSLLPLASHGQTGQVDYAAHAGGAAMGVALGCLLLRLWRRGAPAPGGMAMAQIVAGLGALAAAASGIAIVWDLPHFLTLLPQAS